MSNTNTFEIEAGAQVEGGWTFDDYDTGTVVEVDGDEALVKWTYGTAGAPISSLREAGTCMMDSDGVEALCREAGEAGDTEMVALCEAWLAETAETAGDERPGAKLIRAALKNAWAQR